MSTGCYTEPYLPASFKGVPFHAIEADSEHGRRGAEGEFPFGENTGYADLGRKIRRYKLRGEFRANSHVLDAAALIATCELVGPGPLVHPTRGVILSAACVSLKVSDKIETAGGVTYVDLTFVEANNWPNGLSAIGQLLGLAISPLLTAARDAFKSNYVPTEIQSFRQVAVVNSAQAQIGNILSQYVTATTTIATEEARNTNVNDLARVQVTNTLAEDTDTVDRAITLGMTAVAQNLEGTAQFEAFRKLANGAANTSAFADPAGVAENSVFSLVRVVAAAYMAEAALEQEDYRTDQIFDNSDIIATLLDGEMTFARNTCQNHLYIALADFKNDVLTQLAQKAYDAPGVVQYDFGGATHPLVAAYSAYGDAKLHRDLETLNVVGTLGRLSSPVSTLGLT